jgi:hypothetical protein
MARRKAFVHVGLPRSGGTVLEPALEHHRGALSELGIHRPATADEMFRAAVEMLRDHKAWGYRRRDVEGSWSAICRRAWKATRKGGTVVVGHHLLADAAPVDIDLFLDGLAGFEVHVVLVSRDEGPDLDTLRERWTAALGRPERVHVVVSSAPGDPGREAWSELGRLVGFDTTALPLPAAPPPRGGGGRGPRPSPPWGGGPTRAPPPRRGQGVAAAEAILADALVEAARLRARNELLERRNQQLERGGRRLTRRLTDAIVGG